MPVTDPWDAARVTYENGLRTLGRFLDQEVADEILIDERPEGFAVRYSGQGQRNRPQTRTFTWESLSNLAVFHAAARGLRPAAGPGSFEDVLRTLGHICDQEAVRDLSLRQEDGGMLLAYYAAGTPQKSYYSAGDLNALSRQARSRRRHLRPVE